MHSVPTMVMAITRLTLWTYHNPTRLHNLSFILLLLVESGLDIVVPFLLESVDRLVERQDERPNLPSTRYPVRQSNEPWRHVVTPIFILSSTSLAFGNNGM